MNLEEGFKIERPDLLIPWKIRENQLIVLFKDYPLRHVTSGYFTTSCVSLCGLSHELGFHFHPRDEGVLVELEFFRQAYPDQAASFHEFQMHLEATFGPPSATSSDSDGFPSHFWSVGGTSIRHVVFDRFGPEEHVRIQHA
ncbi:hypothetical protein [Prosthecobacter sp.]|uniref:hypothetical protein n=1 Tax=Prosthecobacter sp. TaxID=1965333 RepID=UPI001D2D6A68|nr:hypothetical protein [Prosthecobacter sp.]MCB1277957.1 hypothetical protein [Prosthecobacter sp.]